MFGGFNGNLGAPKDRSTISVGPMGNSATKGTPPLGISYGTPQSSVFIGGKPNPGGSRTIGAGVAVSVTPKVDVFASVGRTSKGGYHSTGASIGVNIKL